MGSLEEEILFQMVHDFIEPESASPAVSSSSQALPFADHHTAYYILQELLGSETVAEIDVRRRVLKHMRKIMDSEKTSSLKKWVVMRLIKDGFDASLCQTSWPTTLSCPGGEYEFIEVVIQGANHSAQNLIIDIDFKSQFELARPTSSYKELTEELPEIFVGNRNKLKKIISILCSEAKHSLRERGLHIPPWRTSIYMKSKWFANPYKLVPSAAKRIQVDKQDLQTKSTNVKDVEMKDFVCRSGLSREFASMSARCC